MMKSCFLGLKRFQIVVFGPENFFSQIGQKMAKSCFLGPKRVENVFFGQKMAKWQKDVFYAQKE